MMSVLVLFMLILLSGDLLAVAVFQRKFGEVTPITLCTVALVAYCFGLMHLLTVGAWVIGVCVVGIYGFVTFVVIKGRSANRIKVGFVNPVFGVFLMVCLLAAWGDFGQLANGYDDIGHWQDCVKTMVCIDDFYANPTGHSTFGTYPPFMAMIQYVVQVLNMELTGQEFCEWINFLIYHLVTFSLFLPMLVAIRGDESKKGTTFIISAITMIILPTIFFQRVFSSTMIDPFLSTAAGVMFFLIMNRKKIPSAGWILCVLIPSLVLVKDIGVLFAVFGLVFLLYCSVTEKNYKMFWISLIGTVLAKVSWDIVKLVNHTVDAKPNSVNWWNYVKALFGSYGQLEKYKVESISNYRKSLFFKTATIGNTFFKLEICYFLLILCFALLLFGWYRYKKRQNEQEYILPNVIIYGVMLFLFLFGLGGVYMDKFVSTEAVALASYQRYINTILNVLLVELILFFIMDRKIYSVRNACILLVLLLTISPINNIKQFILRENPKVQSAERKDADTFAEELVANCEDGSNIYLVSQGDRGWDYLVIKFMSRPHITLQSIAGDDYNWSFAEEASPNDIYTKEMSLDAWSEEVFDKNDYDYVAVARTNDWFQETFISLFENTEEILSHSIFKVDRYDRKLVPVYVRGEEK